MNEIVVVMVHVWDDVPSTPEIKWQEFGRKCAVGANLLPWPKIWQFDFIQEKLYNSHSHRFIDDQWHDHKKVDPKGMIPHRNVLIKQQDWLSTSNKQTKMILDRLDPKIVLFGGLHKDLCVRGVILDIKDNKREYLESDLLSYTWRETLKKAEEYDPAFAR
jgi:hypothetical protein